MIFIRKQLSSYSVLDFAPNFQLDASYKQFCPVNLYLEKQVQ